MVRESFLSTDIKKNGIPSLFSEIWKIPSTSVCCCFLFPMKQTKDALIECLPWACIVLSITLCIRIYVHYIYMCIVYIYSTYTPQSSLYPQT